LETAWERTHPRLPVGCVELLDGETRGERCLPRRTSPRPRRRRLAVDSWKETISEHKAEWEAQNLLARCDVSSGDDAEATAAARNSQVLKAPCAVFGTPCEEAVYHGRRRSRSARADDDE
jgi:hypothetical protein